MKIYPNSLLDLLRDLRAGDNEKIWLKLREIESGLQVSDGPVCCSSAGDCCCVLGMCDGGDPCCMSRKQKHISQASQSSDRCPSSFDFKSPIGFSRILSIVQKAVFACPTLAWTRRISDKVVPLHIAALIGDTNLSFIIASAWPEAIAAQNKKGKTPLHFAAREGYTEIVNLYLQICPAAAGIATTDKLKLPLHFAASSGHPEICRYLLSVFPVGASMKSDKGKLPLHLATRAGNMETVNVLLSVYPKGLQLLDWEKSPPLHIALREDKPDVASFFIRQYPEALRVRNARGEIPLDIALRKSPTHLVENMIRVWPQGGRIALRNVRGDENVDDLEWSKIDLCLKGAAGLFEKERWGFDGDQMDGDVLSDDDSSDEEQMDWEYANNDQDLTYERSSITSEYKSLSQNNIPLITAGIYRNQEYLPLHSILEITQCPSLICRVLKMFPHQISKEDDFKRLPLHIAVANLGRDAIHTVTPILEGYLEAVFHRDLFGNLPLHIALCNRAEYPLIDKLIELNPRSAVDKCCTRDEKFASEYPLFMATESDCSVDVIFRILIRDPNVLNFINA